ncbi:MAG: adenine deaminase [Deltaproteobacteria bacterium]|jgi:adenine deaminase|nr:adenine deaminase [Deltaproteobacteria bacterium]
MRTPTILKSGWIQNRSPAERAALVDVAMGRRKADLVVKDAQVYNPYEGTFQRGDLAVAEGRVAALGSYSGETEIDAAGRYLIAGFIDSHVHIESSMASPLEFAKCVSAHGTTAVIADPHEIANVSGLDGLLWLLDASENLPISVYVMAPSCVPATPLEKGGATLGKSDIDRLMARERVLGLAEMMNFPGIVAADASVLDKLTEAPLADGHAPGLTGPALAAYIGAGISTDHECLSADEAREHLSLGQRLLLRQGTAARNLLDLLPAANAFNSRFCHLATDDRHAQDLVLDGSINHLVALAVRASETAESSILNMATLNPAEHYGLRDYGALTPGRIADMALYPDLYDFRPSLVWKAGRVVAENGRSTFSGRLADDSALRGTVKLGSLRAEDLAVRATGDKIRVIGVIPGQIVTDDLVMTTEAVDGFYRSDPDKDLSKLAVWDRYGGESAPAVGFIWGLGLKRGALASTVSHDSHNLIAAGVNDEDMLVCAKELARTGGGLALALNGRLLASLPLPLGGIMSDQPMAEIAAALDKLRSVGGELGFSHDFDPFMTLSFMSLPVIPNLKLTSRGLVDVAAFEYVPVVFD